ncbi:hypothetical protein [Microbacterium sp. VKM Ac-2923]|uniref:hypothetical protein n=1 Tax=Microbacterium sp. VKM Ac-2923 TaxID=2929476 RepID=UPI001FB33A35|nr:hypothetical protein [Microbacterium sp. VKM Ac-2923]MCJ1708871.1 hypothetical protein [Microbacterium sp. VKM Ac-2923]
MNGKIWGFITAAIGLTIITLLVIFGTEYGTWLDEIGPLLSLENAAAAPTIALPAAIGLLAIGQLVGGLAVGLIPSRQERVAAALAHPSEAGPE